MKKMNIERRTSIGAWGHLGIFGVPVSKGQMLSVILLCVVLGTASAEELDSSTLQSFQGLFYTKIMLHLNASYHALQPVIQSHSQVMEQCKRQIKSAHETCKKCAKDECQNVWTWVENILVIVANWLDGVGSEIVSWQGWREIGDAFGDVGGWLTEAGDDLLHWEGWDEMGHFFSNVGSGIGNFIGDVGSILGSGFDTFGDFVGDVGSDIGDGVGDIGDAIGDIVDIVGDVIGDTGEGIGDAIGDIGGSFGHAIGHIGSSFGHVLGRRRRRSVAVTVHRVMDLRTRYVENLMSKIGPDPRQCMAKCSVCTPFLGDQNAIIGGVCGDQILLDSANIADMRDAIKDLYDANGNPRQGTLPILKKVEFNRATFDLATFTCGGVYVTAETPVGVVRYPSVHRYNFLDTKTTAGELATELIDIWGV